MTLEQEFLAALYDALTPYVNSKGITTFAPKIGLGSFLPNWTVDRMQREHPDWNKSELGEWRWQIHGTRDQWWLEIVDERLPGGDKPYCLSLYRNPIYLTSLAAETMRQGTVTAEDIRNSISTIFTDTDEKIFGQTEALQAYENGAMSTNLPWIHITELG